MWEIERPLSTGLNLDKRLDGQERLSGVGVGVDGDLFGLLILLAFGVKLHLNLALLTGLNRLLRAFRHGASARALAVVDDEWLIT